MRDDARDLAAARWIHSFQECPNHAIERSRCGCTNNNSIVAWTLSPEWTQAPAMSAPNIAQTKSGFRSTVIRSGWTGFGVKRTALFVDHVSGEINAYTRDHVDSFAND